MMGEIGVLSEYENQARAIAELLRADRRPNSLSPVEE